MLYETYEVQRAATDVIGSAVSLQEKALRRLPRKLPGVRSSLATAGVLKALKVTHDRPEFGISSVEIDGAEVAVREEVAARTPFGTLLRFRKESSDGKAAPDQPKVLIVPGLAGHFATLVRPTVITMLADHDVYVADWHNARDIPVEAGPFDLDEYIANLIEFLQVMGPGSHILSVCQPAVACLAAASIMTEDKDPATPASLMLMAGPVDTRVNETRTSRYLKYQSPPLLERTMLHAVPARYKGAGRKVYPGFVQLNGFISLDPGRHAKVFRGLHRDLRRGNEVAAQKTVDFYDEYFAVLDIDGAFYLDTLQRVFVNHDLPRGVFEWRGRAVDPGVIDTALFTIEGALDEMCPPGQTEAAHGLTPGIPDERRRRLVQDGIGHYGVFAGSTFDTVIYPQIREFVRENATKTGGTKAPAKKAAAKKAPVAKAAASTPETTPPAPLLDA